MRGQNERDHNLHTHIGLERHFDQNFLDQNYFTVLMNLDKSVHLLFGSFYFIMLENNIYAKRQITMGKFNKYKNYQPRRFS